MDDLLIFIDILIFLQDFCDHDHIHFHVSAFVYMVSDNTNDLEVGIISIYYAWNNML